MELSNPIALFAQGLPETMLESSDPTTRNLFIIGGEMDVKGAIVSRLFTKTHTMEI